MSEETRKKRFGDHKDAYLVRNIDPFHTYFAYLANKRADSEVWISHEVDVTELLAYIKKKNEIDPNYKTTMFHCVLAATARLLYERPLLNRFIRDGRFFDRKDVILSFVAKKQFADGAEEALMMLKIDKDWTVDTITKKVVGDVNHVRSGKDNSADDALKIIQKLPPFIIKIFMAIMRFMDRHGLVPKSLMDIDPNYSSVLLSNLGSIKIDAPYHHLNNFGSNSVMTTIGVIHKAQRVMEDGSVSIRDVMNIGITLDERVADGYYYSKCIRFLNYYLSHPEVLDIPVGENIHLDI